MARCWTLSCMQWRSEPPVAPLSWASDACATHMHTPCQAIVSFQSCSPTTTPSWRSTMTSASRMLPSFPRADSPAMPHPLPVHPDTWAAALAPHVLSIPCQLASHRVWLVPTVMMLPVQRQTTVIQFQLRQPVLGVQPSSYNCSCTLVLAADLSTYDLYRYMYCLHWRLGQPWAFLQPPLSSARRAERCRLLPRLTWSSPWMLWTLRTVSPTCRRHCSTIYNLQSAFLRVWRSSAMRVPAAPPAPPPGGGGGSHLARW